MTKKTTGVLTLLISFLTLSLAAQQSINSTGNTITGSGGSVSYSVGQVAYTTYSGTSGSTAQGVQQAYEISSLGEDDFPEIMLQFAVTPNPTSNILQLSVENYNSNGLKYSIFDNMGKIILSNEITATITTIDMSVYQSAVYFLYITDNKKNSKTFKIIKN